MKTKFTFISFLFAFLVLFNSHALTFTNIVNLNYHLLWQVDTTAIDDSTVFRIYETSNITNSLSNWNLLTNVSITNFYPLKFNQIVSTNGIFLVTNSFATNFSIPIVADLQRDFFVATASNANRGESGISDYTVLAPSSPVLTNIQLLP